MSIQFSRQVELRKEVDVLVCGGGPSGLAAATAARRCGQSVLLCEQSAILGGSATLSGVAIYMPVGNITGFYAEIARELELKDGRGRADRFAPQFDPHEMRLYFNQKMEREGVEVWYHTSFIDLQCADGRVQNVILFTREGLVGVKPKFVIDATGNGIVAQAAGARRLPGREDGSTQPMTLMFGMQDTGKPVTPTLPAGCPHYDSVESLPQGRLLHWLDGERGALLVNMTRVRGNGAKIEDINRAEQEALKQVFGVANYLQRTKWPTFRLAWVAPQTGVRETFQVEGLHILHEDDCGAGRAFQDVIAQTDYGIDVHNPTGKAGTLLKHVRLYDIPYRCIVPAHGATNVLVAGRTLSATPVAMSSARVMPTCMALGQAAGCAAALALQNKVAARDVQIAALHEKLFAQGVKFATREEPAFAK